MQEKIKKIFYRSRTTGSKEIDLLLINFIQNNYYKMSESQIKDYEAILDMENHEIYYNIMNSINNHGIPYSNIFILIYNYCKQNNNNISKK